MHTQQTEEVKQVEEDEAIIKKCKNFQVLFSYFIHKYIYTANSDAFTHTK